MRSSVFWAAVAVASLAFPAAGGTGTINVVSNTTDWLQSTENPTDNTIPWSGVSVLPALGTFSITPLPGAGHVDNVGGSTNLFSGSGIRFYRSIFNVGSFDTISVDLQISVDNDVHIFINGVELALEGSLTFANFNNGIHHRLLIDTDTTVTNGYLGGDSFDSIASTFAESNWIEGNNEIILAVRNLRGGDAGGFSFRMDVTSTSPGPAGPRFVDDSAPAGGNGLSWDSPYQFLADALADAVASEGAVNEIRVGQGTYQPDRDEGSPSGTGDRFATFELINGVAVNGGFAGFGAPDPDARDIDLFETILSGDLAGNDEPGFVNYDENSYQVVVAAGVDGTAIIDGFTITGGNADGVLPPPAHGKGENPTAPWWRTVRTPAGSGGGMQRRADVNPIGSPPPTVGAGLVISDGSPQVSFCTFTANFAEDRGGAIFSNGSGAPAVDHCGFFGNVAGTETPAEGGAVSLSSAGGSITNCTFDDNEATNVGGAVAVFGGGSITIDTCAFTNNRVIGPAAGTVTGGAGIVVFNTGVEIANCSFSDNTASGGEDDDGGVGGGIGLSGNPSATVIDCSFTDNTADFGAAIYNQSGTTPALVNCRCTGNSALTDGGAIYNAGSHPVVTNCLLAGNDAVLGGAVFNSGDSTPTFINCTVTDNVSEVGGAMYSEGTSAPAVNNCIAYANSPDEIVDVDKALTTVTYSDVLGGFLGIGNIDADPLFVDPDGPDNDPGTLDDNDYRLGCGSPCIDAADNTAVPEGITEDLDGNPRFEDDLATPDTGNGVAPIVDMGAFEFFLFFLDCNGNCIPDDVDLASGTSQDCNENGIPDECDIADGTSQDCNENGVPDECDIASGESTDFNDNGIPDECELEPGFEEPLTTEAAGGGNFEAIGDFDDNGTPDLAIIIPGETPTVPGVVQVFLNLGTDEAGVWLGLVFTDPVPVGLSPSGIAVGLLDADDLPDVAVTNAGENTVSILINLGLDESDVWQGLEVFDTVPVGNNPSSITAGDLTGDGITDLALTEEELPLGLGSVGVHLSDLGRAISGLLETSGLGLVRILINDGDANMGDAGTTSTGGVGPRGLSDPEDVDNDKTGVELIGINNGGSFLEGEGSVGNVFVLSGDGKGGFGPPLTFDVGENPTDVAVGDFDQDGFPDIAVTNGADGTVSVLLNQGTGAESGTGLFAVVDVLTVGSNPLSVVAADLDGDGDLDLAIVAEDPIIGPAVQILQNLLESGDPLAGGLEGETTLAFGSPASFSVEADPQFVVSADLNGDGIFDLATVNVDADEPTGGSVTGLVTDPTPIALRVHLDIKPGSCPNSFNRTSQGYLPVALVGNKDLNVLLIDLTTIELTRSDGIGGSVAPHEGPPGPHSVFEDVATPFGDPAATDCGCHALVGDGALDLMMKFRRPTLVSVLNLNNLPSGAFVSLKIRGNLLDGTPFEARDCLRLVGNENSGQGRGLD